MVVVNMNNGGICPPVQFVIIVQEQSMNEYDAEKTRREIKINRINSRWVRGI